MPVIELYPTLEHCIQTTAKKEYERLVAGCLDGGDLDSRTESRIEMLHNFLETADFGALREKSDSYLIAGEKVRFVLTDDDGNLTYRMEVIQEPRFE
ncbi:MAG: hypothetical protein JXA01_03970 [Dehalococcoidia bacterium]|nr:hypothetical protein [Dehalococcoidia bacterium]